MDYRIEITPVSEWRDVRGEGVRHQITEFLKIGIDMVRTRDVYTIRAEITREQADAVAAGLSNPVLQRGVVGASLPEPPCDWLIAVGFKPGVTDNVGRSLHEAAGDIIGRKLREDEFTFSSVEYLLYGAGLDRAKVEYIAGNLLANSLIEDVSILEGHRLHEGIPLHLPLVTASGGGRVRDYDLEVDDAALTDISRKGILALSLDEMKAIQNYFRHAVGREQYGLRACPTDVELEVLAQTWSEHCKHKIFAAEIDYHNAETGERERIVSCYKTYIMQSTREIGEKVDWLVSVFHDNAGVIGFNERLNLVYKVETHNSPSALDPYGGAMTGIVGVNRDPLGTGQGADLLINVWGYCLGSPFVLEKEVPTGLLHPRRLRDGIHKGVIDGGNQSGIPYGLGWEYFEERYLGKPLVYCGTVGTLPRQINGNPGHEKSIAPGDLIVMAGGRIGKDGIHGATFSSEELHQESPAQAVQIGDPITQKKMSDFIYEARVLGLYRFITDNGAGGLSSSIGEMAEHSGGCRLDLSKAPLKYAGLEPWEILVSEAQERMSFAVPPEKIAAFRQLAAERDVEATVLGEFTDDGKFHILFGERTVALLDIDFMHQGLPRMKLRAEWRLPVFPEPDIANRDCGSDLAAMVARLNICSNEYKARQYDHEVKGLSVVKPLVGKHRDVFSDATVSMVEQLGTEGIILSAGILPRYSDIDPYHMMASVIDLAIRRIIAVGGKLGHIAGLDNFCWPDPVPSASNPDGEYKLGQLVRANQALYDYTKAFGVPCISGKDSMKNDSTRGGRRISIPPTVLFSAIAKMDDVRTAVTLDAKKVGDVVYLVGETAPELGGSEYYFMLDATGNRVPQVDAAAATAVYRAVSDVTAAGLAASLHTPALGGLAVGFAKVAVGGRLGMRLDLSSAPSREIRNPAEILFSESNSRFIMTVSPRNTEAVEKLLSGVPFARIGQVTAEKRLDISYMNARVVDCDIERLAAEYKTTLDRI